MTLMMKILAIKFKFLGDVAIMTPALRALRKQYPQAELHVLVAEEAVPVLRHIKWIDKVWGFPRRRGEAQLLRTLPVVAALRREKFDKSVDFAGNDRGAIISLSIGAKERLGNRATRGFFGRALCYHKMIAQGKKVQHETRNDLMLVHKGWGVKIPKNQDMELAANSELGQEAAKLLPENCVLCHISSNQPKKEWPIEHWRELAVSAGRHGVRMCFSAGVSRREQEALKALHAMDPEKIECLPPTGDLELFLAILQRAKMLVSGDTGPLHFAAGLKVPTVSLFGPSSSLAWAPRGDRHLVISGRKCRCPKALHVCAKESSCMRRVAPKQVLGSILKLLAANNRGIKA